MSILSLCNTTATVYSHTTAVDDFGSVTTTSDTRYSAMPCRIQPMSGDERLQYGGERTEVTHKMFAPSAYTGITELDKVVGADDTIYDVVLSRNIDLAGHHAEVLLRELRTST